MRISVVFFCVLIFSFGQAQAQPAAKCELQASTAVRQHSQFSTAVDAAVAQAFPPTESGVYLAVLKGNEVVHEAGYGLGHLELGTPWTRDTRYRLASITKTLTAAAVLALVEQRRIDLNASARHYLPDAGLLFDTIKIKHLLSMRAGLWQDEQLTALAGIAPFGDNFNASSGVVTPDSLYQLALRQSQLNQPAGTVTVYTDTNYRLLARIIERVTGKTFAEAMQELLFAPAGMSSSGIFTFWGRGIPCAVPSFEQREVGLVQVLGDMYSSTGDGGAYSTGADMIRLMQFLTAPREKSISLLEQLSDPQSRAVDASSHYRLGVETRTDADVRFLGHSGLTGTDAWHAPDYGFSVILLSNRPDLDSGPVMAAIATAFKAAWPESYQARNLSFRFSGETAPQLATNLAAGVYVDEQRGFVLELAQAENGTAEQWQFWGENLHFTQGNTTGELLDIDTQIRLQPATDRNSFSAQAPHWKGVRKFTRVRESTHAPAPAAGVYWVTALRHAVSIQEQDGQRYLSLVGDVLPQSRLNITAVAENVSRAGDYWLFTRADGSVELKNNYISGLILTPLKRF